MDNAQQEENRDGAADFVPELPNHFTTYTEVYQNVYKGLFGINSVTSQQSQLGNVPY